MIVFRTQVSSNVGIGHLARCRNLATYLQAQNYPILFVVDEVDSKITDYLDGFSYRALYTDTARYTDERSDADLFLELMDGKSPQAIIVDCYGLSATWEQTVAILGCPIVAIDDRDQDVHQCDLLIDVKWQGKNTALRYQNKVPSDCARLLGPQYLLMDERFVDAEQVKGSSGRPGTYNLLMSLGGGGDLSTLVKLIQQLMDQQPQNLSCVIRPVVGPFATNRDKLLKFCRSHEELQPIIGQNDLLEPLKETDFFIGAAGGTLFEALALNIPSLTFSINENQYNSLSDLEDLGHYFHLNSLRENEYENLALLIWLMLANFGRVQQLYQTPSKISIDGKGVNRVGSTIDRLIRFGQIEQEDEFSDDPGETVESYCMHRIDDRAVNHYLQSRNLDINLKNMIETERVSPLHHYIWWFRDNKRVSYLLKRGDEPLLYIWHHLKQSNSQNVLIGGWFVCSKQSGPMDAMYALTQQLSITRNEFPNTPWVAVIHNNNRFVQHLNERLGFEQIGPEDKMFAVVNDCFPMANPDVFRYYVLTASPN
ncbi:UDP-2,4-diacetamido-2,4,6-trideoxy-beta-L-altropyranose hydrolase [bacterium]|nr:UDP-2,4-diacetamido-2,4,6-trideoxy-beta-L-altropyranose hydrolase [bacterium]